MFWEKLQKCSVHTSILDFVRYLRLFFDIKMSEPSILKEIVSLILCQFNFVKRFAGKSKKNAKRKTSCSSDKNKLVKGKSKTAESKREKATEKNTEENEKGVKRTRSQRSLVDVDRGKC